MLNENETKHRPNGDLDGDHQLLDKLATAQFLGISVRTLDGLMKARKVPYLRVSRKIIRFVRADVIAYLRDRCAVRAMGE